MTQQIPFQVHPVQWDRAKSARFWDYISTRPVFQEWYFSRIVGGTVVRKARSMNVPMRGRVLDFGCGPGYLLDHVLSLGVACEGVDFSARSIEMLNERLARQPRFRGAMYVERLPSGLPADTYDTVFLIETIEHLLDDDLETSVAEIRRILKPGGTIVITTPNDEKLDNDECFCPDCGCSFHRIQHVRSWTRASLTSFMEARGFRCVKATTTFFRATVAGTWLFSAITLLRRRKLPNLVWVGVKCAD